MLGRHLPWIIMPSSLPHRPVSPPIVLSFAASDPSGGAGIQADIMTLAALGCHPLTVITALTVQDTAGVEGILAIEDEWVSDQARTLLEDMPVAAFKLGMLGSIENVVAIASIVADYPDIPLVLDPVLASGRGDAFADEDMMAAIVQLLLPQTTLVTPNSLEARRLAQAIDEVEAEAEESEEENEETAGSDGHGEDADSSSGRLPLPDCARRLLDAGSEMVLITGTHEHTGPVINTLYGRQGVVRSDRWPRLPGSYHGSGCTLASAIAAHLAHGRTVAEAVQAAQKYTWHTLAAGFRPGMGQFLPDRHFWAREAEDEGEGEGEVDAAEDEAHEDDA